MIGIGTGLTMHTLLQNLDLASVEPVEIEPAMASKAAPRSATFETS